MTVLGWHGGTIREFEDAASGWSTHDASAVILRDGKLIAAVEEERLNRIKHSNHFPYNAILTCLRHANITLDDVDVIAMNFRERDREVFPCDQGLPAIDKYLDNPSKASITIRDSIEEIFNREFGCSVRKKLFFCDHHDAHLWSAFACSGFPSALVVSIDGAGDCKSGAVAIGNDSGIKVLKRIEVGDSIGNLYSDTIRLLGYKRFDEYKVMGLAPYGDASQFRELFQQMYTLMPNGEIKLLPRQERWSIFFDAGLIRQARRTKQKIEEVHIHIAAALQETTEILVFHILKHFKLKSKQSRLCFAGGVAHNCTLNGKILKEGLFEEVFVQPAAHDAGGALGAAIAAVEATGSKEARQRMRHLYLGNEIGNLDMILRRAKDWGEIITLNVVDDPALKAANLIASGEVIGWVQGASEFGPRALGNRSILADPRPESNRDRVNALVKKREGFRPFAPSILQESFDEIVMGIPVKADLSFMTYALSIRPELKNLLGAVTHVDGSARVQTVSKEINPLYWTLIDHFQKITGIPVVLNTSFNNDAEPIVDTIDDAISCFLTTEIDALIIGRVILRKKNPVMHRELLNNLQVVLPSSKKLVGRLDRKSKQEFSIESTTSTHFGEQQCTVSRELFEWLSIGGEKPLSEILRLNSITSIQMFDEIFKLWCKRFVLCSPKPIY